MKANDIDLTLFQFDYDLTFAVFFMNADKTIYGRYGTRSSVEEATRDMSIGGLAESMAAALKIHEDYPANQSSLAGKQPVPVEYKTPNDFPSLRGKVSESLDYDGAVTRSCVHCHQVRDAHREVYRDSGKPIPDRLMFPNPLPDVIGLQLDAQTRATVSHVDEESIAEKAGFRSGDELLQLDGQPIISLADVQWVLHNAEESDSLSAEVRRGTGRVSLEIELREGWRQKSDISWRVSSWPLRRMGTGGLKFTSATPKQRREAGVGAGEMALVVEHVGQYGAHAAGKRAGFEKGDVVVSFDGKTNDMSTSQLLVYAFRNTKVGERIAVEIVRDGNRQTLSLPMQK